MRLLAVLFASVFLALGCAGGEQRHVLSDAGTVDVQSVAGTRDSGLVAAMAHSDAGARPWQARRPTHAPGHASAAKPVDPAVQACLTQPWANWEALERCLRGHGPSPATGIDGGHLLGGGTTRPPPHCSVQNVPAWFIDPVSGNDNNTGVSNVSALKTYGELTSRWGCGAGPVTNPWLTGPVVITFLSSQPNASDRVIFNPIMNEGASAYLVGQWTQIATGTLSSVVPKSTSAADGRLQADLGGAASGHLAGSGLFLVNASRGNSVAAVNQVLSGTTVALTQPYASNAPTAPTRPAALPSQVDTWANGDTWQLMQLPGVYITEYNARTPEGDLADNIVFSFAEHIWVPDPTGPFVSNAFLGSLVQWSESWIDPIVFFEPASGGGGIQATNTELNSGALLEYAHVLGGSINGGLIGDQSRIDGDAVINFDIQVTGNGSSIGRVCVAGADFDVFSQIALVDQGIAGYGSPHIYGTYTMDVSGASEVAGKPGASLGYDGAITASSNFLGVPTFQIDHNTTAIAVDNSHGVTASYPGIIVTPGNLDTSIAAGGFDGVAHGYAGSIIAPTNLPTISAATSPYFAAGSCIGISQPVGGQVTITNTCPSSGGTLSGSSVSGPGFWWSNASSVLETTGVTFGGDVSQGIHSTGFQPLTVNGLKGNAIPALSSGFLDWNGSAWVFASAPVSSVTGAGATTCSPTTGAVTCTTSNTVANGLTGATSFNAHSVLVGEGTAAISSTGPNASTGIPLVSQGASADPSFGTAAVAGGGTGVATLTSHGVLIGEGSSSVNVTSAGVAGELLTSNGASADPTFKGWSPPVAPQHCASSSVNLPGTTPSVICSLSVTTPNDGVTRTVKFDGQVNVTNTNPTTSWLGAFGFGTGGSYTIGNDVFQVIAGGTAGNNIDAFSTVTTQSANTSVTYQLLASLNSGATGVSASGNLVVSVY